MTRRILNSDSSPSPATPEPVKKYGYGLKARIAVCKGAGGYYTITVNSFERETLLALHSMEFVKWLTDWMEF